MAINFRLSSPFHWLSSWYRSEEAVPTPEQLPPPELLELLRSKHPYLMSPFFRDDGKLSTQSREIELQERINRIYKKMGGSPYTKTFFGGEIPSIVLKLQPEIIQDKNGFFSASRRVFSSVLHFPAIYLLSPEEFPEDLKVNGPDDPQLNENAYYQKFNTWIQQQFNLHLTLPKQYDWEAKIKFKEYIRFMQNPEMANKALDFILYHEIAHIYHGHLAKGSPKHSLLQDFLHALLDFALFLMSICIWIYEPTGKYFDSMTNGLQTKKNEWEADKTAIKLTRDVAGACYVLQNSNQTHLQIRNDPHASIEKKFSTTRSGDSIGSLLSHQLNTTRIAAMQALKI